jgi:hypothetical protein
MKIKDLSSSNTVAGEGLMCWKVEDLAGRVVNLDLPGYHIPGVEVCLLSPQVILLTFWWSYHSNNAKGGSMFGKWFDSPCTFMPAKSPSFVTICAQ